MSGYAETPAVSSDKSRAEIERTLARYGATEFAYGTKSGFAMIGFRMEDRYVKFYLPLPSPDDRRFTHTAERGHRRHPDDIARHWEQGCRQAWRALALAIKAKLEAVAAKITTFEDEFLAHIVLPGGRTVADEVRESIAAAYSSGHVQPLLPDFSGSQH